MQADLGGVVCYTTQYYPILPNTTQYYTTQYYTMLSNAEQQEILRRRTFAIISHPDAGKTTLTEKLLLYGGAIHVAGAVKSNKIRKTATSDWMEIEKQRGISVATSVMGFDYNNYHINILDTPGHQDFAEDTFRTLTAVDSVVIVIDSAKGVEAQTRKLFKVCAMRHIPIFTFINKMDREGANPDHVKQQLAEHELIPEDWGGDTIMVPVSAHKKMGISDLLEMILLVAEMQELKANPNLPARGTIIEAQLDKGRGPVATLLVQNGTLKVGDIVVAGTQWGKVKAIFNERNQRIKEIRPAEPALILGLNGAPAAGDTFNVVDSEREAREITGKREQLQREQGLRTQKMLTLDEVGRRIALGNFQTLNIIVKGDVDGSIEALSDSLIKLSTETIQVNVIHKAVGQISESDVSLAAASDAIIVGFQVRPSVTARKVAENEGVDIRIYSIIYDAIEEVKAAMEGMLAPDIKEEITATLEIRETFKITKVGTIAGCMVKEGKLTRSAKVRVIRDGIVIYTGSLGSLKRFKDDVKEVQSGYDCGLNIDSYNDIKVGDVIECFIMEEIER
mgnify:CR=1 FL=1